jgi:hypothetical protein
MRMPRFTPQFTILLKYLKGTGWLYNALSYSLRHVPKLVQKSIVNDDPIWRVFISYFVSDFNEKKDQAGKKYSERECSYLIEVFYFFWPSDKKETDVLELANAFVDFCKEAQSFTSLQLLSLMVRIFSREFSSKEFAHLRPKNETAEVVDKTEILKHLDPETETFII